MDLAENYSTVDINLEELPQPSEEMQKIIDNAKNDEEKKAMEEQKYLMASLLRRQKTLDFLASL